MATALPKSTNQREITLSDMRVSAYDKASSLVIALLVFVGSLVTILVVVWLTATIVFRVRAVPVKLIENVAGRGDHAAGFERDMEAPGLEEMPELAEPQLETAIEAVTDAVSSIAASMDNVASPSSLTSKGEGGMGDSRPPGPLGEGDNIIPRWERWEVRFESTSEQAYARQLDFFGIELGAAGGGKPNIDYAVGLAGAPRTRSGPSGAEKRLYMTWQPGSGMARFDRNLLQKAGINAGGRILLQFYPEKVEDALAWMEMQNAGGKTVKEFLRTVFGVRSQGNGYEFYIIEQRFRPPPR